MIGKIIFYFFLIIIILIGATIWYNYDAILNVMEIIENTTRIGQ